MELAYAAGMKPVDPARLPSLAEHYAAHGLALPAALADQAAARPTRIYLGHEFCERLLPQPRELAAGLAAAGAAGLAVTLATPAASDAGVARIARLLPLLPDGTEVVCGDWGVAALVRRSQPRLVVVAGRQLCRMIKDPRLPSPQWAELYPHGLGAASFALLLARCGVAAIEIDLPPFARHTLFDELPRPVIVHAPFGCAAKGRSCRIGSLAVRGARRFAPGHPCRKECRSYRSVLVRPQGDADLATLQSGNALLYRHSAAMGETLAAVVAGGRLARLVLGND